MGFEVPKSCREADSGPGKRMRELLGPVGGGGQDRTPPVLRVPWEIEPSSQGPPPSSSLPPLIPDQEELDEEINNLRKELRVKVNRLYEAQGKRSPSGSCSVPGSRLVHQEGAEIP